MDNTATNYNPDATVDDGSCTYAPVLGCMDNTATNYNPDATVDDGTCKYDPVNIPGCMDKDALNYNPNANVDDNSCQYLPVFGCTDVNAVNHNPQATIDDGSCKYSPIEVPGCMDPNAVNYDNQATIDDGSCEYIVEYLNIVSTPGVIATVGQQYSYQVLIEPSATNGNVNYELLNFPQGMTINSNGLVQYIPTQKGFFQVKIKVSRNGLEAFQTYMLQARDLSEKGSLRISSVYINPEQAHAGDYAAIYVDMKNNGHKDLEDVQITAVIYDLGMQVQSDKIDLDQGDHVGEVLYVHVPYYTQPGEYLVTVSVKNNEFVEESYRFFSVN
jgi:hypothetical protein